MTLFASFFFPLASSLAAEGILQNGLSTALQLRTHTVPLTECAIRVFIRKGRLHLALSNAKPESPDTSRSRTVLG